MRPEQLILENVGSFRGRHTVELTDVDLFVLAGPTGAGKSTVIDAITLALYGSVARYDNANLIEPAINKLATQSTVSLTFTMAGERYVATRQIARTSQGGASAKEVRLERVRGDGSTTAVASGSREVDDAVVRLLGLTFDEFCKTVVLPQGAFAEFLHGGRKERQDLLVRLLGLGVYEQVGKASRARATALEGRIAGIRQRLEDIGEVDGDAVADAARRAEELDRARAVVVDDLVPQLEGIRERWHQAKGQRDTRQEVVTALQALSRPDGVDDLAERVAAADAAVRAAEKEAENARAGREEADRRAQDTPSLEPVRELLRLDEELAQALGELEQRTAVRTAESERAGQARTAAADARTAADQAASLVTSLRRQHVAHDLAAALQAGEDCPVCLRPIDELPDHETPEGLAEAEEAAERSAAEADRATAALRAAEEAVAAANAQLDTATARVGQLREKLQTTAAAASMDLADGRADRVAAEERVAAAGAIQQQAAQAREAVKVAEEALAVARQARAELDGAEEAAWGAFQAARDRVAAYGAPPADRRDGVAAAWDGLLAWSEERAALAVAELAEAQADLDAAAEAGATRNAEIRKVVADAGVDVPDDAKPEQALDLLSRAATEAGGRVEQLRRLLDEADRLRAQLQEQDTQRQVAELVGSLLRRDQFEQWLLNRLSSRLVAGASRILSELTQGAFSLVLDLDKGAFEVIDHLNADERRPAKTLSGGETFLASLALALSLAEHVAAVNQAGAARLDALFLDEGFGTLDPETLETVAAAIEELSGSRMVGVITHVRELAERIPYRFDVRRGPDGSTITPAAPDAEATLTGDGG